MKALVLAGGSGTRLRPFSYSVPKQLMSIVNKPVLEHVLGELDRIGVTDVGIVVGHGAAQIADVIGDGTRLGMRITYIRQESPKGLAHAVRVAREFLGDDDFVMYLGDNMLPEGIGEVAAEFRDHRTAARVVVRKVADPRAFGVVELDADGGVTKLVEKPSEPLSDLALIGVYFFTAAIHDAVVAIEPSARGELEITDAVQWLLDSGAEVAATEYAGYWRDIGSAEDVLECNRRLLDDIVPDVLGDVVDSELVGPVVVEPGARVVRSRVQGPAVIGAGTLVQDSQVGPHTTVGRDCVIDNARLRDTVVLDGAAINDVRGIDSSLIGRSATVGTTDQDARVRLVIGDFTQVRVAA